MGTFLETQNRLIIITNLATGWPKIHSGEKRSILPPAPPRLKAKRIVWPKEPKKQLYHYCFLCQSLGGQMRANTTAIKIKKKTHTQTQLSWPLLSSASPSTHQPQVLTALNTGGDRISPQTSKHNMEIKHTETHHCVHTTHLLVPAVILTMLVGDPGWKVGVMSVGLGGGTRGSRRERDGRPVESSESS